jgi:hypothetical protein
MTKRGFRTIDLDDGTVALLVAEKQRHQRLVTGVPDGIEVDLSLVKLPAGSLMFPASPETGEDIDLTKWRNPRNFSKEFARRAGVIGFGAFASTTCAASTAPPSSMRTFRFTSSPSGSAMIRPFSCETT